MDVVVKQHFWKKRDPPVERRDNRNVSVVIGLPARTERVQQHEFRVKHHAVPPCTPTKEYAPSVIGMFSVCIAHAAGVVIDVTPRARLQLTIDSNPCITTGGREWGLLI